MTKKVPILMMCNSLGLGGVEKTVINYAKTFDANKFTVYVGSYVKGGVREEQAKNLNIEYINFNRSPKELFNFIRGKNIQALHSHEQQIFHDEIFPIIRKCKSVKSLIQINIFSFKTKYDQFFDKQLFISMSNLYKYDYIYGTSFDYSKRAVLYNPIDSQLLNKFVISGEERNHLRKKIGISKEDFVIGKIARKTLSKWSDLNLDILPGLVKADPRIKFLVVGMPDSRYKLAERKGVAENIIRLPETIDTKTICHYYQCMDALVHFSSIGECCSASLQEAMFFKLPIITNSTPFTKNKFKYIDNGQVEQVAHGQTGYIANDINSITEAIISLASDPTSAEAMGRRARRLCIEKYELKKLTKILEKETLLPLAKKEKRFNNLLDKYKNVELKPTRNEIKVFFTSYPILTKQNFINSSGVAMLRSQYYKLITLNYRKFIDYYRKILRKEE